VCIDSIAAPGDGVISCFRGWWRWANGYSVDGSAETVSKLFLEKYQSDQEFRGRANDAAWEYISENSFEIGGRFGANAAGTILALRGTKGRGAKNDGLPMSIFTGFLLQSNTIMADIGYYANLAESFGIDFSDEMFIEAFLLGNVAELDQILLE